MEQQFGIYLPIFRTLIQDYVSLFAAWNHARFKIVVTFCNCDLSKFKQILNLTHMLKIAEDESFEIVVTAMVGLHFEVNN